MSISDPAQLLQRIPELLQLVDVPAIRRAIAQGVLSDGALPVGHGFRLDERIVEYPWLFSRLPSGAGNLLDAGSVLNYEFLLSQSFQC